jgi:hypothetical protein
MTMHILPAYYTTTNTRRRKAKVKSAPTKHDLWLMKNGVHPDQIKLKKGVDKNWKTRYTNDMMVDRSDYVSAGMSGSASSCVDRSLMSNLHKEPEHVRKAILDKASRVMPLFNKGGLQYATPDTDMTQVGSKSRRG